MVKTSGFTMELLMLMISSSNINNVEAALGVSIAFIRINTDKKENTQKTALIVR